MLDRYLNKVKDKLDELIRKDIERDIIKVRVHDGIVGLLYIGSIAMANEFGFNYIYIALAVAVLQILSPITKFCPVYTILNKLMPDTEPIQNGIFKTTTATSCFSSHAGRAQRPATNCPTQPLNNTGIAHHMPVDV